MELYIIKLSNSEKYYFTSNTTDITTTNFEGSTVTYKAIPISRKELVYDLENKNFVVIAPLTEPVFQNLDLISNVMPVFISIRDSSTHNIIYQGTISTAEHDYKKGVVDIKLKQRFTEFVSEIPKKTYSKFCPYRLGDKYCTVNLDTYSVDAASGEFTIDELTIYCDNIKGYETGYFTNGMVRANTGETIWILDYNGTSGYVKLITRFTSESKVSNLTFIPGCDRSIDTCVRRFNNKDNFGGFPYIPDRNPATKGFR